MLRTGIQNHQTPSGGLAGVKLEGKMGVDVVSSYAPGASVKDPLIESGPIDR